MKPVRIVFSDESTVVYTYLQSRHDDIATSIVKSIEKKKAILVIRPGYGDSIPKRLIPKEYIARYGINNLRRLELPHGWRMLYSLGDGGSGELIVFVISALDHKTYDNIFGYS